MSKLFKQPANAGEFELEVKKSRFLVRWQAICEKGEFAPFLQHWRQRYPDARHHCWAYCIGHPQNSLTQSCGDDSEPSGTAGRPMLSALVNKGVGNIAVVVIRYFGGTKLGAGGLIRAYSGAVSQAMDRAEFIEIKPRQRVVVCGDYALEQPLRHWLSLNEGQMLDVSYAARVAYHIELNEGPNDALEAWLGGRAAHLKRI
ncbi:IMPACT family protein [Agaribacterium haliotis]|uniref:IMPACT family protein n=1 Tax=Agaribacterium haliotis TaxID=2013869 RepID=UPI000BB598CE|nr:YigZ family protein [Agaribacterium haliotis]